MSINCWWIHSDYRCKTAVNRLKEFFLTSSVSINSSSTVSLSSILTLLVKSLAFELIHAKWWTLMNHPMANLPRGQRETVECVGGWGQSKDPWRRHASWVLCSLQTAVNKPAEHAVWQSPSKATAQLCSTIRWYWGYSLHVLLQGVSLGLGSTSRESDLDRAMQSEWSKMIQVFQHRSTWRSKLDFGVLLWNVVQSRS